jgi:hypothetical protein
MKLRTRPAHCRQPHTEGPLPRATATAHHRPSSRLLFAVTIAGLIAVAGCGTASESHTGGMAKPPKATLSLRLVTKSGSAPKHWTLRCDPAGGTAPDPASTCRTLMRMKEPFAPPKKHMMCPMIMVSSRQIVVTGTWFGQKVDRVIIDGECDLGLYNSLHKIIY